MGANRASSDAMLQRVLLFSLLPVVGACDGDSPSSPSPSSPVNQTLTLAAGQTSPVADTTLSVRFEGVTQDSRCPGDALCIQQGDATAVVFVIDGQQPTRVELKTAGDAQTGRVGQYRFTLQGLMPYPFSSLGPIAPADYRATIVVQDN